MRRLNKLAIVVLSILVSVVIGCKDQYKYYDTDNGINFYYPNAGDTLISYSFVYRGTDRTRDTVWIDLETIGNLTDYPREVRIVQVPGNVNDAVAGQHYIAFGDSEVSNKFIIPARAARASIPVIVLRDPSLKSGTFRLTVEVTPSEEFKFVNYTKYRRHIDISDQLSQPKNWAYYINYSLGVYGQQKHAWLIEHTLHRWDDEFLTTELGVQGNSINANYDGGYYSFFIQKVKEMFAKYAQQRIDNNLEPLKEADGTIVKMSN